MTSIKTILSLSWKPPIIIYIYYSTSSFWSTSHAAKLYSRECVRSWPHTSTYHDMNIPSIHGNAINSSKGLALHLGVLWWLAFRTYPIMSWISRFPTPAHFFATTKLNFHVCSIQWAIGTSSLTKQSWQHLRTLFVHILGRHSHHKLFSVLRQPMERFAVRCHFNVNVLMQLGISQPLRQLVQVTNIMQQTSFNAVF